MFDLFQIHLMNLVTMCHLSRSERILLRRRKRLSKVIVKRNRMLENTDKINWTELGDPNIPRWLEGLTSVDRGIRSRAIYRLSVDVIKEDKISDGNLHPASALSSDIPEYIVPFLIELLTSQSVHARSVILDFLDILVSYHLRFKNAEGKLGLEKEHLDRAKRIYNLILNDVKTYQRLLRDSNSDVSKSAKLLLESLGNS